MKMRERVLVIDDDPSIRMVICRALGRRYEVLTAQDGMEGLTMARTHDPDVVVLDMMMPRMDGVEVCKNLQEDPYCSHLPVLMLTALSETDKQHSGLKLWADDYIKKPFDVAELSLRLHRLIERSRDFVHTGGRRTRSGGF